MLSLYLPDINSLQNALYVTPWSGNEKLPKIESKIFENWDDKAIEDVMAYDKETVESRYEKVVGAEGIVETKCKSKVEYALLYFYQQFVRLKEVDFDLAGFAQFLMKRVTMLPIVQTAEEQADAVDEFIGKTPLYANADLICAVPPSKVGDENLPARIIGKLTNFKGVDISKSVRWTSKTASLKNAEGADRLEILNHSGFEIVEGTDVKGKDIVLVDDLYMSGITLQYVAMKLKEAGARRVYGLCCVKSFGNK